jgi:hypothetical protein
VWLGFRLYQRNPHFFSLSELCAGFKEAGSDESQKVENERPVKISGQKQVSKVILARQPGFFTSAKGLDLPADRAVVRPDRSHTLHGEVTNQIRAQVHVS